MKLNLPATHKSTHLTKHSNNITKLNPHIGFILDGSGSMEYRKDEAIYSFNMLLRHQVLHRRKATFNLTTFARKMQVGPIVDIKQCGGLNDRDYQPMGDTPLYDAIGLTCESIDNSLNNPKDVVIVIITDGYENASTTWKSPASIRSVIEDHITQGWTFVYCSCSHTPIDDATKIGIPRECATDFTNLPEVFKKVSNLISDYRSGIIKQITFEGRN